MSNLLATKLRRPTTSPKRVHRPHLIQCLNDGLEAGRKMMLVSAPPGFGKTTLLSEWVAQLHRPAAWLSLDEGDNDPIRFWTCLIAACRSVHGGVGEAALTLFHSPEPLPDETIPTILINDLIRLENDLVLILDDYHLIQNQSIHTALSFLLDHLPDQLHLVLSTRVDPPWPLARLRTRNQLIELRATDLRFSIEEAAAFLNQVMELNLTAEDVAALEARTEGWIASLQLAAIAMQSPISMKGRNDLANFVKAFTGSHVYVAEYLVEEVLRHQSEDTQTFLLRTSILERLSAKLCEAVTGRQDGQVILMALHRSNLFVIPLDDEGHWFRYHRLFADLLQAHLRQTFPGEAIATLHTRASRWYEAAGMVNEAIQHALAAADYATVVRLIESHAVEMLMQGYTKTVEGWLTAIPSELRLRSIRINLAFAWMHLLRGAFAAAAPHVERLQTMLAGSQLDEADPSLKAEWLALQAYLLSARGQLTESLELARRARDIAPETDGYVQSLAYNALGSAYLMLNDYTRVVEVYQKTIQHGRAAANSLVEMLGISVLAQIATQHGQLHFAYELASQGIDRAERSGSPPAIVMAVHGALGQVHYQWAHLAEAQSHFLRAIQLCALSGYTAGEIYGRANFSRLLQIEGNLPAADQEIQQAIDLMRSGAPAWGGDEAVVQQVRLHLAQHQQAAAESMLAKQGFSFKEGFSFPDLATGQAMTYSNGLLYNSALHILLHRARTQRKPESLQSGIKLADRLINGALQSQYFSIVLEALLLRAQMHATLGNAQAGLADVAQALERAEPEGFISIFVEAGSPIAESLAVLLKRAQPDSAQSEYIQTILTAYSRMQPLRVTREEQPVPNRPIVPGEQLVEPLTPRELEVLQLIAAGDSNQTIADNLVITVRTVKKHTTNIYGKLNAGSRTQAVARARELGLLSTD
jgi:LuxR family transcriptional regulator, maltose regulon positive regulatory protein